MWTNGTISARDAVSLGARILVDHFTLFTDLSETMGSKGFAAQIAHLHHLVLGLRDEVLHRVDVGPLQAVEGPLSA